MGTGSGVVRRESRFGRVTMDVLQSHPWCILVSATTSRSASNSTGVGMCVAWILIPLRIDLEEVRRISASDDSCDVRLL